MITTDDDNKYVGMKPDGTAWQHLYCVLYTVLRTEYGGTVVRLIRVASTHVLYFWTYSTLPHQSFTSPYCSRPDQTTQKHLILYATHSSYDAASLEEVEKRKEGKGAIGCIGI